MKYGFIVPPCIVIVNGISVITADESDIGEHGTEAPSAPCKVEPNLDTPEQSTLDTPDANMGSPRKKWKSTRKCFKARKIHKLI